MQPKRTIEVSEEMYAQLERAAQAMGLSIEAYLGYRENEAARKHDRAFRDAVAFAFKKYPKTLRKLSQ